MVIDLNEFSAALITALHFFGRRYQRFLPFACTLSLRAALSPTGCLCFLSRSANASSASSMPHTQQEKLTTQL